MRIRIAIPLAVATAILFPHRDAAAQGPRDALVQAPTFKQPERGSLVGGLAKFSIGAEDVSRGSYALDLPIAVPSERGALLAAVFPSYGPENGVSEWGIGWSVGLAIQRFSVIGDIDYQADSFISPWGRLEIGSDGFYYPAGLKTPMRLERQPDGWVATSPDGTRYQFRRAVQTADGVYAWYLTRVDTLLGDAAAIDYDVNTGGRPFVAKVRYGGRESPESYRLDFEYETLPVPLLSFRSGSVLALDRRVTGVVAWAKEGGDGAYGERWRYDLTYRDSAFGPGFYLDSLTRTFASGETEPPTSYDYDVPEQTTPAGLVFRIGDLEAAPGISTLLDATDDPDGIRPDHAAVTDIDDDGLADLEHAFAFTLYRQTASGDFTAQPLPPPPSNADTACRPRNSINNRARAVVRMAGAGGDVQVLTLEALSSTTNIRVCSREGVPQITVNVPGRWRLGANLKLVDLNRDEKPDLLLVDAGAYRVLENISGEGCGPLGGGCVPFGFRVHPPVALTYARGIPFTPSATWSHDMNGDGNPDLMQRANDRVSIWYGRGRFRFDNVERQYVFVNRRGDELFNLNDWQISWVDANKDGLTDAVMVLGREPVLFMNQGEHFQEVTSPTLDEAIFLSLGVPVVGDLRGRGDLDLNFLSRSQGTAAALTDASVGLMIGADDGKGTSIRFDYERAAAEPGLRQRPTLLRSVVVTTAGYDPVQYDYTYAAPRMHTVGHFLIGFGTVQATGPQTNEQVDFYHDNQIAAQVETARSFDARTPSLMKFSRTSHEEALHTGVRVRRATATTAGWCSGDNVAACLTGGAAALETTEFLAYERGICPTHVRRTNRHGQLDIESGLAAPSGLTAALHCLSGGSVWTGAHADVTRDFRLESRLSLNDLGQVTKVEQLAAGQALTLQEIAYDPTTHRVASISAPGQGVQTFGFDAATGLLKETTGADGVVASARTRNPTTDALLELVGDRGPGGVLVSSFRYDGMERLNKTWVDFGGSSADAPLLAVSYQFPTTDFPALMQISNLVDAAAGTRQESASWAYPDGAELASATRIPEGWVFGGLSTMSRSQLSKSTHRRAPLPAGADVATQTYGSLLIGMTRLHEAVSAGFGHEVSRQDVIQQGTERRIANTLALESGLLVMTSRENDRLENGKAVDASGHIVWIRDQNGNATQYDYDALGRLIAVNLVDGTRHSLSFDGFGRPAQVTRDRLGDVRYFYDPANGRLDHKEYRDADGGLERTVQFTYDDIGRLIESAHVQPRTAAESHFRFRYDGDVGEDEALAGQKGYTTQVEGPAYKAKTVRNPDGSQAVLSIVLAGWMQMDVETTYYASGAVKTIHRTITRLSDGAVIDDVETTHHYDAWGRVESIEVNGSVFATLHYDTDSRLAWADLPDGQRIDYTYDPATFHQNGYRQKVSAEGATWHTGVDWTFNDRGLVSSEAIEIGDETRLRSYLYEPRGFLSQSQDTGGLATYTYTPVGLPDQSSDDRGTRGVFRGTARTITVANVAYVYDASGRVIRRGNAQYSYGPDGNLALATIGSRAITYAYDAEGNRILKVDSDASIAAYLGGGVLTNDVFVSPVKIGGRLVGVLENGSFQALASDPRGTRLADRNGTPRLATPYGVRLTRPDLAEALDYVEKAYDSDLESVRMGVRDYDPLLGQFWTPDPLYLEAIEKCVESPVECNLFAYARNNPISFVDPTGMCADGSCFTMPAGTPSPQNLENVARAMASCGGDASCMQRVERPPPPIFQGQKESRESARLMGLVGGIGRGVEQGGNILSFVPGLDTFGDAASVGGSVLQGNWEDAGIAGLAMLIPGVGAGMGKGAKELAEEGAERLGESAVKKGIPDDAFVVRGGVATPEQIANGIGPHRDVPGLAGFSAQSRPGATVEELAATGGIGNGPFPHGQVSVSTAGQLRCVGCDVVPSPGAGANHVTVTPGSATPAQISEQLIARPNPARRR